MSLRSRVLEQTIAISVMYLATIIASLILILIIGKIAIEALPALSIYFLTTAEVNTHGLGQAVGNSLIGTLILSILSVIFAIPIAIGTAIYLKRYAPDTLLIRGIRFMIEVLSGMPSIVLGVFGLLFFVVYLMPITGRVFDALRCTCHGDPYLSRDRACSGRCHWYGP